MSPQQQHQHQQQQLPPPPPPPPLSLPPPQPPISQNSSSSSLSNANLKQLQLQQQQQQNAVAAANAAAEFYEQQFKIQQHKNLEIEQQFRIHLDQLKELKVGELFFNFYLSLFKLKKSPTKLRKKCESVCVCINEFSFN